MALTTTAGMRPSPRRILLYGVQGIGKSTFGVSSHKPVIVQTENSCEDLDCEKYNVARSYGECMDNIREVRDAEHDRQTLVVDTVDWFEPLVWAQLIKDRPTTDKGRPVSSIEDYGFKSGYEMCLPYWRAFYDLLTVVQAKRGMEIILLAHSTIQRYTPPDNEAYDRYAPKMHKAAAAIAQEWATEVLFTNYKTYTKSEGTGLRERKVGLGNGDRSMFTTNRPTHFAKNRLHLDDEMIFSWDAFDAARVKFFTEKGN
jgi:hypothetical protein